jgi:hypothetical protein
VLAGDSSRSIGSAALPYRSSKDYGLERQVSGTKTRLRTVRLRRNQSLLFPEHPSSFSCGKASSNYMSAVILLNAVQCINAALLMQSTMRNYASLIVKQLSSLKIGVLWATSAHNTANIRGFYLAHNTLFGLNELTYSYSP